MILKFISAQDKKILYGKGYAEVHMFATPPQKY